MDPNTTLSEFRKALAEGDHERAAELADALDGWLTAGGFLPAAWERTRRVRTDYAPCACVTLAGGTVLPCDRHAALRYHGSTL